MPKSTVAITVRLDTAEYEDVAARAQAQHISVNEYVRRALALAADQQANATDRK